MTSNFRFATSIETRPIATVEVVTPAIAAGWLANQHQNRPMSDRQVALFAKEMAAGRWHTTNQGIGLDWDGRLVDGQHRAAAVVKSGCNVAMLVLRGVPRTVAIAAVDQGKQRSYGQLIAMREGKGARGFWRASVVRTLSVLTRTDGDLREACSTQDKDDIAERYRASIDAVSHALGGFRLTGPMSGPIVLSYEARPDQTLAFIEGISTGANLHAGDARLALRNWVLSQTRKENNGGRALFISSIAKTVTAVDAFWNGEPINRLYGGRDRYIRWCRDAALTPNASLLGLL